MQEPLDLLNFINNQPPDLTMAPPMGGRAPDNIPIPSGITSLTGYQEGGFVSSEEGISGLMAMLAGNADKRPRNEGFFVGGDIPPDPYNIGDRGFLVDSPEDGLREMYSELSPEDIEAIRRVMMMRQQKIDR